MKICIVLNGEIEDYEVTRDIIIKECYDCIICADGGANHTYKMEIMPDYILGDLDITGMNDLNKKLYTFSKGASTKITVNRGGKAVTINVNF
ncbi:thiamine diphosphokinase [Clostridioides difficile]|uniref:thiamine diphosphokinase n=1 Tax=Clostridioides difficile TaxID=1496 RepID=UPI00038CCBF5|nr:thiamine diphosphokinase [Clostridioides difficile]EQH64581.1 thiamine diphosphokinase domain protein [Clostridioides difficile DA00305]